MPPTPTGTLSGPIEPLVLAVWEEILGRRLGVHEDLFEAGAHSLHVLVAVSRLRGRVSVRDVFELKTVAALSAVFRTRS